MNSQAVAKVHKSDWIEKSLLDKKKHKRHKTKRKTNEKTDSGANSDCLSGGINSVNAVDDLYSSEMDDVTVDWRFCKTPSDCQGDSPDHVI